MACDAMESKTTRGVGAHAGRAAAACRVCDTDSTSTDQDETGPGHVADKAHLRGVAASIDEAADDLDANGPVPAEDLRRALLGLEAEWAAKKAVSG